jgi:hypothetical protein
MIIEKRICKTCKQNKPVTEFYKHPTSQRCNCKKCDKDISGKWKKENPEKSRLVTEEWRKEHPERVREIMRKSSKKRRMDVRNKLSNIVGRNIRRSLLCSKAGRHWETLVGYTVDQLKKHLEKKFKDGMTWGNHCKYGWHIDHIIPISAFNFSTPEDIDFKKCWALSNLQPLWAKDNLIKHNKLEKPFQPSLNIQQAA